MSDTEPQHRYTPALAQQIERRWQDRWELDGTFHAVNPSGPLADDASGATSVRERPKFMVQDMFPYPSGAGLHVGHPLGFIATDVVARYQRMRGRNVLYTLGYDAFGLPAEQYAVQTGQHPRKTTEENIETYIGQLRKLGLSHDERRAVQTIDPAYYKWTQWIFTRIYNSWYDEAAGKARPIADLIAAYENGVVLTPSGQQWSQLSASEQASAVDGRRLAYKSTAPVNWAPGLGTVVANEEVTNEGLTERGDFPVFRRNLPQWMMRITAYADRLIEDLDRVDWPESVKAIQRNWIGRSQGAAITFPLAGTSGVEVFTTRPDTIFGATYLVLAPEHELVDSILPAAWPEQTDDRWTGGAADPATAVAEYRRVASRKSDLERQVDEKTKTGVFTGVFATNPVTDQQVPVFIADYVLMGYGTGAIMAVPAEDPRDWEFAAKFGLPHVRTVQPPEGHDPDSAYTGSGPMINSANDRVLLNAKDVVGAKATIIEYLEGADAGHGTISYKLRDWLFSRQRYWGEPFPIVYDETGAAHAIPEHLLPVELPEVADYSPKTYDALDANSMPESPLSRATEWVTVELDLGDGLKTYTRETDVMPQWAGSCWYEMRYTDPCNNERFVDRDCEEYWMGPGQGEGGGIEGDPGGVDLYIGGVEHAVLHLLYARFWHKVLFDLGEISSSEPFRKLFNQGYIQAFAYRDARGQVVPAAEVVDVNEQGEGSKATFTWNGEPVTREYGKMGKSLKNVVTPDEMCERYGADTFRVYEMSMGPLDMSRPWETRAVVGSQRFLQRLWRNVMNEETGEIRVTDDAPDDVLDTLLHRTIDGVRRDFEHLHFHTATAKLIELNNVLTRTGVAPRSVVEPLVAMTAPLAPHIAEELWKALGHNETITFEPFPQADPAKLVQDTVTCVVQVLGKVRDRIEVAVDIDAGALEELARANTKVIEFLGDKQIRKVVVRAPKLVNIVAG